VKYLPAIVVVALFLGALYFRWRTSNSRRSDFNTIETYATAKDLRIDRIREGRNHWRYWLSGHLLLSNIARTYVINGTTPDGKRREIHVAIDPMSSDVLKVLQEEVTAE
jgi:hypothetical protein